MIESSQRKWEDLWAKTGVGVSGFIPLTYVQTPPPSLLSAPASGFCAASRTSKFADIALTISGGVVLVITGALLVQFVLNWLAPKKINHKYQVMVNDERLQG